MSELRRVTLSCYTEKVVSMGDTRRLADLGCDLAQGWAVGYPQPRNSFMELFRKRSAMESRHG